MARKNKRARANYLRKDYRKGGRVKLASGSSPRPKRSDYGPEEGRLYQQELNEWTKAQQTNTTTTSGGGGTTTTSGGGGTTTTTGDEGTVHTPTFTTPTTTTTGGGGGDTTTDTTFSDIKTSTYTPPKKEDPATTTTTTPTPKTKRYPRPDRKDFGPQEGLLYNQELADWEENEKHYIEENPAANKRTPGEVFSDKTEEAVQAQRSGAERIFGAKPEIPRPEAVGYQRNPVTGDLILDSKGNPLPLAEAATEEMGGFIPEGYSDTMPPGFAYPTVMGEGDAPGMKWVYSPDGHRIAVKDTATLEKAETAKATMPTVGDAAQATRYQRNPTTGELVLDEKGEPILLEVDDPTTLTAKTYTGDKITGDPTVTAAQVTEDEITARKINPITGKITGEAEFATVDDLKIKAGEAERIEDVLGPDDDYLVKEVEGEDTTVNATPEAEVFERTQITGKPAPDGDEAFIDEIVGYEAAKQRIVKGKLAQRDAADMIAADDIIPPDIAAAIVQDPETVEAQLDEEPVEVQAAIAALPTEALVSSQMQTLLGGMEDGEIPLWAKPAVAAVNQGMAARGLSVSTVGRDSLFNAIIQSALPMAQSNAQALQQRAAQNLSNQQQSALAQSTQDMQRRMANLANRQAAGSQTAQMSQQMKVLQSQFDQQAVMTTAEQRQQTRTQDLQNRQQEAVIRSQNEQQMRISNLASEQQLNMAELQVEANAVGANQSAKNQELMVEFQVAADFMAKNEGFKQQMELANLSNDQQMRLANLSSKNLHQSELLSNDEKIELANLNKTMQTNQLQAQLASQMGLAQLNVDQQSAIQNATTKANMDLTKFSSAQQIELANSKFMQTVAITDMNAEQQSIMQRATAMASMDIANLNVTERLAVTNAQNFLAMDMANLNNNQQANMLKAQQTQQRLLSNQSATNAALQFNATSQNQTDQFMTNLGVQVDQYNDQQKNAMEQFNAQQKNAQTAMTTQVEADLAKSNAAMANSINQFNAQNEFNREQWNSQNAQAVEQSNVAWRRQANTVTTAAANQVAMQNAQNAFGMSSQALSFLWQEMRDRANYDWQSAENYENRKTQIIAQALANEGDMAKTWSTVSNANWTRLLGANFEGGSPS
tara:strand:+ start:1225 stop:4560 length:3336 start_codon:yes stop_codon:yes gene_type:complete